MKGKSERKRNTGINKIEKDDTAGKEEERWEETEQGRNIMRIRTSRRKKVN